MAWPIIGAAIGAVGLITSFLGSKKAEKAAKDQSKEEARMEGLLTDEKLRQLDKDERSMFGETVAGYTGGGVLSMMPGTGQSQPMSGSPQNILGEQAREFAAEKKITKEVGASNVKQTLMGGQALADRYRYSGYANVASSISSIITNYQLTNP